MTATRDRRSDPQEAAEPAWDDRPIIGRTRGLLWWAAVLIAFGVAAAGAIVDMKRQGTLGIVYQGAYVVGCVAAICSVRRRSLFGPMVQPPLVFAVTAVGGVVLLSPDGTGSGLRGLVFTVALPLTSNFPTMAITTGVTAAIGAFRLWWERDPNAKARANRDGRDDKPARGATPAPGRRDRPGKDRVPPPRRGREPDAAAGRGRPDAPGPDDRRGFRGRPSRDARQEPPPGRDRAAGRDPSAGRRGRDGRTPPGRDAGAARDRASRDGRDRAQRDGRDRAQRDGRDRAPRDGRGRGRDPEPPPRRRDQAVDGRPRRDDRAAPARRDPGEPPARQPRRRPPDPYR